MVKGCICLIMCILLFFAAMGVVISAVTLFSASQIPAHEAVVHWIGSAVAYLR